MPENRTHGPMTDLSASGDLFSGRFVLRDCREETDKARQSLLQEIEQRGYEPTCSFAIRLALEEALSNAFKHGNKNDPAKVVTLECVVDPRRVVLDIEDQGEGFELTAVPDPTQQENLEIPSGRGIVLMRSFMTTVIFTAPGNRVRLVYERP